MLVIKKPYEFIWDKGNSEKNFVSHNISNTECEEAFFDENKKILKDSLHSINEPRYILLGRNKKSKLLFVVFTMRGKKIRVISCRKISKIKEINLYEKSI